MKTKYENGILSFERDGKEKVFCLMGTIFGDGERFCKLITKQEAEELYDEDMWSKPFDSLRISESSYYSYWFANDANIITRLA